MSALPETIRQSEWLGQLVIDRSTMEELGTVELLWMYPPAHRVLGFICKTGFLGGKKLAFNLAQVKTMGSNGILVSSKPQETDGERVRQLESPIDCELWNDAGSKIGKVVDYQFNPSTGIISEYLFVSNGFGGITGTVYRLPPSKIISIGRRRVLVPASQQFAVYREGLDQKITKAGSWLKQDYQQVTQELQNLTQQAQQATTQAKSRLQSLREQAQERARLLAEQARERAELLNEQLRDTTQIFTQQARERSQDWVERVKEKTEHFTEDLEAEWQPPTRSQAFDDDFEEDDFIDTTAREVAPWDDWEDDPVPETPAAPVAPPRAAPPVDEPASQAAQSPTEVPATAPGSDRPMPVEPEEIDPFADFWDDLPEVLPEDLPSPPPPEPVSPAQPTDPKATVDGDDDEDEDWL